MHRRTACAFRQATPYPSPRIDFKAPTPRGWGKVLPFVPRRRTTQVPAPAPVVVESVPHVPQLPPLPPRAISYPPFRMEWIEERVSGSSGDSPKPFIGIPQKPTPQNLIAAAMARFRRMPLELQKAATRKRGIPFSGSGHAKAPLRSSQVGIYHRTSKSGGSPAQRKPKKATPPLVLDDALFQSLAERAWLRCKPPHILHPERVLPSALAICHQDILRPDAVCRYLVKCLYVEVDTALRDGVEVTRGLLRKIVDRALGLLVKWVRECVKKSAPIEENDDACDLRRRLSWVERDVASVDSRFTMHFCCHPDITGGKEVYLLLDCANANVPKVHGLWDNKGVGQFLRRPKSCCRPVAPPASRLRLHAKKAEVAAMEAEEAADEEMQVREDLDAIPAEVMDT